MVLLLPAVAAGGVGGDACCLACNATAAMRVACCGRRGGGCNGCCIEGEVRGQVRCGAAALLPVAVVMVVANGGDACCLAC